MKLSEEQYFALVNKTERPTCLLFNVMDIKSSSSEIIVMTEKPVNKKYVDPIATTDTDHNYYLRKSSAPKQNVERPTFHTFLGRIM